MKIVVWNGCQVVSETEYPNASGPDIHLDPWNLPESISVRRGTRDEDLVETSESVDLSRVAR